ncbi:hypothetical protein WKH57_00920 [Niallia taxi]|uniref:hypothetical protein n=1 Tax=Niallia taxi TaxID=2499688 RepID=UPI00317851A5
MSEIDKIRCSACGKTKRPTDYYVSYSSFHRDTGKLHVCKMCILDSITSKESLINTLRMIDKPFIETLFTSSTEESEKTGKAVWGLYMKNVSMGQYKTFTWNESDFKGHSNPKTEEVDNSDEVVLSKNIIRKWGRGYTESDIDYLENFYNEYDNTYATDTPVQINLYKNIAKIHLQAEKDLAENNTKSFKELMELSSKLHNDGNIKPIQSTGANDDKGVSTYGLWIKEIEQDEPCEFFENKPLYEDYDKLKKYWEDWFVRPFKNIFNLSKDFNVRDDD